MSITSLASVGLLSRSCAAFRLNGGFRLLRRVGAWAQVLDVSGACELRCPVANVSVVGSNPITRYRDTALRGPFFLGGVAALIRLASAVCDCAD